MILGSPTNILVGWLCLPLFLGGHFSGKVSSHGSRGTISVMITNTQLKAWVEWSLYDFPTPSCLCSKQYLMLSLLQVYRNAVTTRGNKLNASSLVSNRIVKIGILCRLVKVLNESDLRIVLKTIRYYFYLKIKSVKFI